MTKASRIPVIGILLIGVLCSAPPASAEERPAIAAEIARTYGLESFGQVEAIRYTFNIDAGPKLKVTRTWVWEPKKDQITYEGPDNTGKPVKVGYTRSELASQSAVVKEQIDPGFFNDQYWLLFPFHLVWDTAATVKDEGMRKLPLGKGSARKISVKYPSSGGYYPGDTWNLYVGKDGRIQQLHFQRGGDLKPSVVIATWAEYKKVGPLLVSMDHRGTVDGKPFRLFFSDVSVKVSGSEDWVAAR